MSPLKGGVCVSTVSIVGRLTENLPDLGKADQVGVTISSQTHRPRGGGRRPKPGSIAADAADGADGADAIARGERPAPTDAARPSFNSAAALVRLLTPDNRQLLALIRDRKPQSVVELVKMTGRAQPNLTRTLAKLEAAGFFTMRAVGRRKAPSAAIKKIVQELESIVGVSAFHIISRDDIL